MSWTYDPTALATSDRDELRFILQDTETTLQLLQNEELDYLIGEWLERFDSITFVAAIAAEIIARKFTAIVTVSADGVSVNTADLSQRYRDMAVSLREEYKSSMVGAEVDIGNILINSGKDFSLRPLRFGMGLHDNSEAGLQDYGGWTYDPFAGESMEGQGMGPTW